MRKYQMFLGVFITPLILSTGFKKNTGEQNTPSNKSADISYRMFFTESPKVNIADVITVQGEKGQKTVEVTVFLSKSTPEKVTMNYSTKNGTAKAGVDYSAISGSISFEPGERMKQITVFITGEVAADPDQDAFIPGEVNFQIAITNVIGALLENGTAIITIIKNILRDPRVTSSNQSVYEVELNFVGYTSLGGTAEECGIRPTGAVTLSGLLYGVENVSPDDDISYTGTLQMFINIDVCSIHRLGNGEDRFCGIQVYGSGTVYTELEIYYGTNTAGTFDGRGGYIKIKNKDGRFRREVTGSCEAAQVDDEWTMIPNESIASVFNGKDLPMLVFRTLRQGTYRDTDDQGNITQVKVIRKIR